MGFWFWFLLAYVIVLSVIGFFTVSADKRKAQRHEWRTPERTFLLLSLFGGGAGVLIGFFARRHKTKHIGLIVGVVLLSVLCYGILIYLYGKLFV